MPIGKNSIKRVANNGYANLESRAPDMENSTVVEKLTPPEAADALIVNKAPKKKAPKTEKTAPVSKKTAEKKPKKAESVAKEKPAVEKKEAKTDTDDSANESTYVSVGEDMPAYLL